MRKILFTCVWLAAFSQSQQLPDTPVKKPKKPIFSKPFLAAHAVYLAANVFDSEMTHQGLAHHKCVEANTDIGPHPSRGAIYRENLLPFAAITGLDIFMQAAHLKFIPYGGPIYGTVSHIRGGLSWAGRCW